MSNTVLQGIFADVKGYFRSYQSYRWQMFVEAIETAFPGRFQFIATTLPSTALTPAYKKIDYHVYSYPEWFISNANMCVSST